MLDADVLPDNTLVNVASDDYLHLGVLSSWIHVVWALAAGGRMGIGNDPRYNKTRCFDPFPFPAASDAQADRVRDLAEQLDAHRKRVQAEHPDLTLTGLYNALAALRGGGPLSEKDRDAHDRGLVGVLRALHDDLDAAVADAYGWPADLPDEAILSRLVALNAERAAEEARGVVRYLRPAFQDPEGHAARVRETQSKLLDAPAPAPPPAGVRKFPPKSHPVARYRAVRGVLAAADRPLTPADVAAHFKGAGAKTIAPLLAVLADQGRAGLTPDGRYTA